jgi:hypothetical protein
MDNDKITKLKIREEQLQARIMAKKARDKKQERKNQTRRKILVGAIIMDQYEQSGRMDQLLKMIDPYLVRDNDRVLFGFEPLKVKEKARQ